VEKFEPSKAIEQLTEKLKEINISIMESIKAVRISPPPKPAPSKTSTITPRPLKELGGGVR